MGATKKEIHEYLDELREDGVDMAEVLLDLTEDFGIDSETARVILRSWKDAN